MNTTLIPDIDGVLITTPSWKQDILHEDRYLDFNSSCVANLNKLLSIHKCEIRFSSTRRNKKSLTDFNNIFKNRHIDQHISDFLTDYKNCSSRREEVEQFIRDKRLNKYLIIDDEKSLQSMKTYNNQLIITDLKIGFSKGKLQEVIYKIEQF